jgi:hypothetical protein
MNQAQALERLANGEPLSFVVEGDSNAYAATVQLWRYPSVPLGVYTLTMREHPLDFPREIGITHNQARGFIRRFYGE